MELLGEVINTLCEFISLGLASAGTETVSDITAGPIVHLIRILEDMEYLPDIPIKPIQEKICQYLGYLYSQW